VQLVNRSKKALCFELVDSGGESLGKLEDCGLIIFPRFPVTLGARDTATLELTFAPRKRVLPFCEDLHVKYLGTGRKLMTITGQCIGYEVALETDAINFGTVCLESSITRKLTISNNGELAARFRWEPRTFGPHIRWDDDDDDEDVDVHLVLQ
jgi:hydrocephalus-inducing protein